MSAKLTVLVPNYNRPSELSRLLASVFASIEHAGAHDTVSVLVVDDFSDQDLSEVIQPFVHFTNFRFTKRKQKCGNAEVAFLTAIDQVDTEYVWLFGNDDEVGLQGIKYVLSAIQSTGAGLIVLNPCINKEELGIIPISTTTPSVIYRHASQLFMDWGFVTSTTTFSCLVMKTNPVKDFHRNHRLTQFASVYSHTFTLFGALRNEVGLFLSAPFVDLTFNDRLEEDQKLLRQAPDGIRFFHHSLGLARLIRECAKAMGIPIQQIGSALEDEVNKDSMEVNRTYLSHFLMHFFIEQLCREQDNIQEPAPGFGHLLKSEIREITDVIEQFDDPILTGLAAEIIGAFVWQLPGARWKTTFFRKAQTRVLQIASGKVAMLTTKRSWTQPLKISVISQVMTPLQGVGGDWSGWEIPDDFD
jgi:glycosyltransferase involved in cell wall biosynthesis